MRAAECEKCHQAQPREWQPGELCVHCGGAVRADQRCAACTEWTPSAKFCRHCAAELLPEEHYGAGRMLIQAGVDALSLAERVRALDPAQREVFSSRFAVQRALVEVRVEEARFCETFLFTKGHADRLEDDLVRSLPWKPQSLEHFKEGPKRPFDDPKQLKEIREHSPAFENRILAAAAQLRLGHFDDELLSEARSMLQHEGAPYALDAALALTHWRLRRQISWNRWFQHWAEDLEKVLAKARTEHRDSIPVALAWAGMKELRWGGREDLLPIFERDGVLPHLKEALGSTDDDVRFSAALLLGDDAELSKALDHSEPLRVELARNALSRKQSPVLVDKLATATAETPASKKDLLRALKAPLEAKAFIAVVDSITPGDGDYQRDAIRKLTETPFDEVDAAAREHLERWLEHAPVSPVEALEFLRWAVDTGKNEAPYRLHAVTAPYAQLGARVFAPQEKSRQTVEQHGMASFFAAVRDGSPLRLVREWLEHDATSEHALRQIFHLQSYLHSYSAPKDFRAQELLLAAWAEMKPYPKAAFAERFAEAARREGSSAFEPLLELFWNRLLSNVDERPLIWRMLKPFRQQLEEKRDADPRRLELTGGKDTPLATFWLYSDWEPLSAPELLGRLTGDPANTDAQLTELSPVVFDRAERLLREGEHRHALWLASRWIAEATNRFRRDESRETWRATVATFPEANQKLEALREQTSPKDPKDDLSGFTEHIETELRLAREVLEHEEEQRERVRERERRKQQQEEERKRREEEAAAEQRRQQEEAAQRLEQARAAIAAAQPAAGGSGVEFEVLCPDQPIKTLADYVAFMKAMRSGADIMALFAQYGLTPTTWGTCAGAWTTVMMQRPELGMKFAQLLQ